jgi:uncharacterized RDD family membrane protein YckC
MAACVSCGGLLASDEIFCGKCGTRSQVSTASGLSPNRETASGPVTTTNVILADKGVRVAGYLIDVLPTLLLALVAWIPIVGIIFMGLVLVPYWLLRDVTGGSLGKLLLGLKVVARDGSPATVGARILRNVPLILGPACAIVPFLGYIFTIPVSGTVILIEGIMLLSQGERLGDRLAKTIVVRK